jgi:hypothetical protein
LLVLPKITTDSGVELKCMADEKVNHSTWLNDSVWIPRKMSNLRHRVSIDLFEVSPGTTRQLGETFLVDRRSPLVEKNGHAPQQGLSFVMPKIKLTLASRYEGITDKREHDSAWR